LTDAELASTYSSYRFLAEFRLELDVWKRDAWKRDACSQEFLRRDLHLAKEQTKQSAILGNRLPEFGS
jgi:hypothetical protein